MRVGHINLTVGVEVRAHRPLCGGVGAVEGVFELDDGAVPVLQDAVLRCVVVHQLGQGGKLLPAIQVVVVSCVLDPDVGHQLAHPEEIKHQPSKFLLNKKPPDDSKENISVSAVLGYNSLNCTIILLHSLFASKAETTRNVLVFGHKSGPHIALFDFHRFCS